MVAIFRPCLVCGSQMLTKRSNRAICSSSCHGKWHRARVKLFPSLSPSEVFNHLEEMQEFLTVRAVMKETAVSAQ